MRHCVCVCVTQDVLVEGAGEVDVDQLPVVQCQAQDLTSKLEVVQVVRIHRGVTVGLEGGACDNTTKTHTHTQKKSKPVNDKIQTQRVLWLSGLTEMCLRGFQFQMFGSPQVWKHSNTVLDYNPTVSRLCEESVIRVDDLVGQDVKPLSDNALALEHKGQRVNGCRMTSSRQHCYGAVERSRHPPFLPRRGNARRCPV